MGSLLALRTRLWWVSPQELLCHAPDLVCDFRESVLPGACAKLWLRRQSSEAPARRADPGWQGGSADWGWGAFGGPALRGLRSMSQDWGRGAQAARGCCRNRPELCRGLCFLPACLGELLAGSGTPRQAPFHRQPPRGSPSDRLLKGGL